MDWFLSLVFLVLGLCVGSFVNMAVYRYVKEGKITGKKRSFCDFCGRQLGWNENIPVISWVIQRGKSKCCGNPLPRSYPVVELLTGILFLVMSYKLRVEYNVNVWQMTWGLVVVTLLVFSAVVDAKYQVLPDFSTGVLIVIAFLGVVFDERNLAPYLLSALGGAGVLGGLNLITRGRGMGMGDVKLAVFMGLFLGWPKILVAFYVAFISGALVGLGLLMLRKVGRKSIIAFGPFLIFGTGVAWYYGSRIWEIVEKEVLP